MTTSNSSPVWFIAGASSGFGLEIAKTALSRGHIVIATARSTQRLRTLAELGAHTLALDVTAPFSTIAAVVDSVYAQHGRVDYLINAAGYLLNGAVEEMSLQEIQDCFQTNVFGIMMVTRAFVPRMRAQDVGANGVRATIALFGSLGSWGGTPSASVYCMTKASVSSLGESLRSELKPFNIVTTTIEPGYFRTSFMHEGVRAFATKRVTAYDDEATPSGQLRQLLDTVDGKQPGDVVKGGAVVVDVLSGTGVAKGREVPLRLVLGTDSDAFIREKCADTVAILNEWEDVAKSTDFSDGSQ